MESLHSELCDATTRYTDFFVQFREVDRDGDEIKPTGRVSKVYGWRWDRDQIQGDGSVGGWLDVDDIVDADILVLDAAPRHFDVLCDDEHEHLLIIGSRGSGKSELGARWLLKRIAIAPKKALSLLVAKRKKARRFVEKKLLGKMPDSWLSASLGNKGRKGYRRAADEISLSFKHGCLVDCLSARVPDDARGDDIVGALIDETQLCPAEARANLILSGRDNAGADIQTCETATLLAGDFEEYLDACRDDETYLVEELSITDNVHLDTVFDEYYGVKVPKLVIWARHHQPKADFEQEIGKWDAERRRFCPQVTQQTGLVYYQYKRKLHVREYDEDSAGSVVRTICSSIEPLVGEEKTYKVTHGRWRTALDWVVGVDFEPEPFAAVACKVFETPSGWPDLLWVIREFGEQNADASALGYQVYEAIGEAGTIPDAAGRYSEGKKSSVALLRDAGLNVRGPIRNPAERDRINALNGKLENGAGQVSLIIDPSCTHTISALQRQRLGANKAPGGMRDGEDHYARALGHIVHYLYPITRAVREAKAAANA